MKDTVNSKEYLKTNAVINDIAVKKADNLKYTDIKDVKILFSDEGTLARFEGLCECSVVNINCWKDNIIKFSPDIFFITASFLESGLKKAGWFKECVDFCKSYGVKTAFWDNCENVYSECFLQCAKIVDFIFAVSFNKLVFYKSENGLENTCFLPFAAKTQWINLNNGDKKDNKLYFLSKSGANSDDFTAAVRDRMKKSGFDIAVSNSNGKTYLKRKNSSVPGDSEDALFKNIKFGGFYDPYSSSSLYVPEEVFEITASGALAVGNNSRGTGAFFGDSVITQGDNKNDYSFLDEILQDGCDNEKRAAASFKNVLKNHLYTDRLNCICNKLLGINPLNKALCVEVFSFVNSLEEAYYVLDMFLKQSYENKKITIITGENIKYSRENVRFIVPDTAEKTKLSEMSDADCYTVFSKEDCYGENYLSDLMLPLNRLKIDAAVKSTYFYAGGLNDITEKNITDNKNITKGVVRAKSFTDISVGNICDLEITGKVFYADKYSYCADFKGKLTSKADDSSLMCKVNVLDNIYRETEGVKPYYGMFYRIDSADLYSSLRAECKNVSVGLENGAVTIAARIKRSGVKLNISKKIDVSDCFCNDYLRIILFGQGEGCGYVCSLYNANHQLIKEKSTYFNNPIIFKCGEELKRESVAYLRISFNLNFPHNEKCIIRKIILGDEGELSAAVIKGKSFIYDKSNPVLCDSVYKFEESTLSNNFFKARKVIQNSLKGVNGVKIACFAHRTVFDDFYKNFNSVLLTAENWESELNADIDLLIIEFDRQYNDIFSDDTAEKIISECNENQIPVALICKNPGDYSERLIKLGGISDYIFTSDINTIPQYKRLFNHSDVYLYIPVLSVNQLNLFNGGYRFSSNFGGSNTDISSPSYFDVNKLIDFVFDYNKGMDYSRALKLFFGDLISSDDSSNTIYKEKQRLALLRKILEEFSAKARMEYVFSKVFGDNFSRNIKCAEVLGVVKNSDEALRVVKSFNRQSYSNKHLNLAVDFDLDLPYENIKVIHKNQWENRNIGELFTEGYLAVFSPDNYYGENYLKDIVLLLENTDYSAIGKGRHFYYENFRVNLSEENRCYSNVNYLDTESSVIRLEDIKNSRIEWLSDTLIKGNFAVDGMFNYCRNYKNDQCDAVSDISIAESGKSCREVQKIAEAVKANSGGDRFIYANEFFENMSANMNVISAAYNEEKHLDLINNNDDDKNTFVHFKKKILLSDCPVNDNRLAFIFKGSSENMSGYISFYDKYGVKLDVISMPFNILKNVKVPESAYCITLSVAVKGKGEGSFYSLCIRDVNNNDTVFIPKTDTAVLTNCYPSANDIYKNMFVHQRVLGYSKLGFCPDVLSVAAKNKNIYRTFENADITECDFDGFENIIKCGCIKNLCVHFINPQIWDILKRYLGKLNIFIWCHGYDIQPWHRRAFAYEGEVLEREKAASAVRMKMWNEIFQHIETNSIKLVFVSEYLLRETEEDYKITIPQEKYEIIPNCIDTRVFDYVPKDISKRTKIMSVKSYVNSIYANDITAEAIYQLSKTEIFNELEFDLYGDGPLFEKCSQKIADFENVHLHREFLPHDEIAKIHKEHGIYIATTRMDTQGVSRGEAMSSGLVPITNAVGAIPEFVDDDCGIVVPAEDYAGVAEAIVNLYNNPELFLKLSENAAKRIRTQLSEQQTVAKELELIKNS